MCPFLSVFAGMEKDNLSGLAVGHPIGETIARKHTAGSKAKRTSSSRWLGVKWRSMTQRAASHVHRPEELILRPKRAAGNNQLLVNVSTLVDEEARKVPTRNSRCPHTLLPPGESALLCVVKFFVALALSLRRYHTVMASGQDNKPRMLGDRKLEKDDQYYFDSYAHLSIHQEMIQDKIRTDAYRDAIMQNKALFKDKTVMDLGAGTGILSFFCARAGAKRVYAVEASGMADHAKTVVEHNNMADTIQVFKCRAEEITEEQIPSGSVDIIVSEWMGYFLLYESMFDSVVAVRERFLNKATGLMFPSKARMLIAPMTDEVSYSESVGFWDNVYGIDMSCLQEFAKKCAFEEPIVDTFDSDYIIGSQVVFKELDTKTVGYDVLNCFTSNFSIAVSQSATFSGFISWFDVDFPTVGPAGKKVVLSTSPYSKSTHWRQTLFYFYEPLQVKAGQTIVGKISVSKSTEHQRWIDITIDARVGDSARVQQKYTMR